MYLGRGLESAALVRHVGGGKLVAGGVQREVGIWRCGWDHSSMDMKSLDKIVSLALG